jgi:uncharacterized protein YjiK
MDSLKLKVTLIGSFLLALVLSMGCKPKKYIYKSPPHYDFSKLLPPYKLDIRIKEISGIVWDNHNDEFIAHNDEKGAIYYLDKSTAGIKKEFQFNAGKGDYEDIAMVGASVYVLKSNGTLFKIGTDSSGKQTASELDKLGVPGKVDFEAMYYDADRKALVLICKNCEDDDKKTVSAYAYYTDSVGFDNKPLYKIDAAKIKELTPRSTSKFQPSAARIHPVLKKLFIISSASNQLVIADTDGNVESVYMLAQKTFPQPEGLTFKTNGDMFISNEGVANKATLLTFRYIP